MPESRWVTLVHRTASSLKLAKIAKGAKTAKSEERPVNAGSHLAAR